MAPSQGSPRSTLTCFVRSHSPLNRPKRHQRPLRELDGPRLQPPKKQPRRRKPAAHDIPVLDVVLEPPERMAPGGEQLEKIGEEVAEHFERKLASMIRVRVIRPKYKLPSSTNDGATTVAISAVPERRRSRDPACSRTCSSPHTPTIFRCIGRNRSPNATAFPSHARHFADGSRAPSSCSGILSRLCGTTPKAPRLPSPAQPGCS